MDRFSHFQVACSRFVNTIFLGDYDEMLSSRVYRERNWFGMFIIDTIFFWEKNHCRANYEWENELND